MPKTIRVLHEDEFLIAFDKPPGLLVIPSSTITKRTLVDIVNEQQAGLQKDSRTRSSGKLHPCHRLDRDTSGVILFAKGKKNQQLMMEEFRRKNIGKKYVAFVRGELKRMKGEIKIPISDFHEQKFRKQAKTKSAITRYQVTAIRKGFSVVDVFPETGRTNQIRIHFSKIGHPLLGERVYAFRKDFAVNFRRLALHAAEIRWQHPVSKKKIKVEAELPEDMRGFFEK